MASPAGGGWGTRDSLDADHRLLSGSWSRPLRRNASLFVTASSRTMLRGTAASRKMLRGTATIEYSLYQDAARQLV